MGKDGGHGEIGVGSDTACGACGYAGYMGAVIARITRGGGYRKAGGIELHERYVLAGELGVVRIDAGIHDAYSNTLPPETLIPSGGGVGVVEMPGIAVVCGAGQWLNHLDLDVLEYIGDSDQVRLFLGFQIVDKVYVEAIEYLDAAGPRKSGVVR